MLLIFLFFGPETSACLTCLFCSSLYSVAIDFHCLIPPHPHLLMSVPVSTPAVCPVRVLLVPILAVQETGTPRHFRIQLCGWPRPCSSLLFVVFVDKDKHAASGLHTATDARYNSAHGIFNCSPLSSMTATVAEWSARPMSTVRFSASMSKGNARILSRPRVRTKHPTRGN